MKRLSFVRSVRAKILAKNVEQRLFQTGIAGDSVMAYGLQRSGTVHYRVTFITEEGMIPEMEVPLQVYLLLEEGAVGTLRFDRKFRSFTTDNPIENEKIEA